MRSRRSCARRSTRRGGISGTRAGPAGLGTSRCSSAGWATCRPKRMPSTDARATFLLTPQGEQRVANLNKLTSLARALEESGLLTFRAFVHWIRDMEEQAVDEAESPTVEEGDNVVRMMSIHAAKGLEFPI